MSEGVSEWLGSLVVCCGSVTRCTGLVAYPRLHLHTVFSIHNYHLDNPFFAFVRLALVWIRCCCCSSSRLEDDSCMYIHDIHDTHDIHDMHDIHT